MSPNKNLLQIRDFQGEGFQPLVTSASWQVGMLRYMDSIHPARIDNLERHLLTDEVFVLVQGRGVLILGNNGSQADGLTHQEMEIGVVYNIRAYTWHTILLSRDAAVLIVENSDTGEENTEICGVNEEIHKQIISIARQYSFALD